MPRCSAGLCVKKCIQTGQCAARSHIEDPRPQKKNARYVPKPTNPGMLALMFSGMSMNGTDGLLLIIEKRAGARAVRGLRAAVRLTAATPGAKALTKAIAAVEKRRDFRNETDGRGSGRALRNMDAEMGLSAGSFRADDAPRISGSSTKDLRRELANRQNRPNFNRFSTPFPSLYSPQRQICHTRVSYR